MHIGDFDFYRDFLYRETGVLLSPDQSYMIVSRLTPVAKRKGFPTLTALTMRMRALPEPELVADIVDALVSGETAFFRHDGLFSRFGASILPWLLAIAPPRRLRIWDAGCSTGQEAYSLAIALMECADKIRGRKATILGTDINRESVRRAQDANYIQAEIQRGLTNETIRKYFVHHGDFWRVRSEVRGLVRFERLNLLSPPERAETFDLVVCCGILPAMTEEMRGRALNTLLSGMDVNSLLFLGEDPGLPEEAPVRPLDGHPGFYVRVDGPVSIDAGRKLAKTGRASR